MDETKLESLIRALRDPIGPSYSLLNNDRHRQTVIACWDDIVIISEQFLDRVNNHHLQPEATYKDIEARLSEIADTASSLALMLRGLVQPVQSKEKKSVIDTNLACAAVLKTTLSIVKNPDLGKVMTSSELVSWEDAQGDEWIRINGKRGCLVEGPRIAELESLASFIRQVEIRIAHGKRNAAKQNCKQFFDASDPYEFRQVVCGVYDAIHFRGIKRSDSHVIPISQAIYRWTTGKSTAQGKAFVEEWKKGRKEFDYSQGKYLPDLPPENS